MYIYNRIVSLVPLHTSCFKLLLRHCNPNKKIYVFLRSEVVAYS